MAEPCPKCKQTDIGQTGECPCPECGLPTLWDRDYLADPPGTASKPQPYEVTLDTAHATPRPAGAAPAGEEPAEKEAAPNVY